MNTGCSRRVGAPRWSALLAVGVLVLTACGDDGSDEAGVAAEPLDTAATTVPAVAEEACTPSTGVTDDEILVGGLYPTTGPEGAFFAAVGPGILARFAAENDQGGVDGRELVLVHADDGDGEIANAGAAEFLVETEGVFGLIQISTSGEGSAEYLHDAGIPVVGWAITPSWGRYDNMFGYRHSTAPEHTGGAPVSSAVALVERFGGERLAILSAGTSAALNQADHARATAEEIGVEVVYMNGEVPLGADDFRIEAERVSDAGADSIYLALQTLGAVEVVSALRDAGVDPRVIVMGAGYDARVAQAFGSVIDGALIPVDWRPYELPIPAHDGFRRWLAEVDADAFPGQLAMVGWLAADAFVRGVHEAGSTCPTRAGFVAGLRAVGDHTAAGLLPSTDFAEQFGRLPSCFWYLRVVGTAFEPVDDEPLCGIDVPADYGRG